MLPHKYFSLWTSALVGRRKTLNKKVRTPYFAVLKLLHKIVSIVHPMQLIKTTRPGLVLEPPPDLTPALRPAYLELIAVGIRGIQPYEMLPIQLPHVEIEASRRSVGRWGKHGNGIARKQRPSRAMQLCLRDRRFLRFVYGSLQPFVKFNTLNCICQKLQVDLPGQGKVSLATNPSKKPSGPNANFLERLAMPLDLPVKEIFSPRLKLRVVDNRLGG